MKRTLVLLAAAGSLSLATAACSSDTADEPSQAEESTGGLAGELAPTEGAATEGAATEEPGAATETTPPDASAATLVGPGCDAYTAQVPEGAGSVAGMAQEPLVTAARNNPMLKTLAGALTGGLNPNVDLADTLNTGEYTVFAPVDAAFADVDAGTLATLAANPDTLTNVLSYHVVEGRLAPDEVVGEQTTLEGASVDVTGEGDSLMVNDASVICGGLQTENATVYLIDTLLMPPS